MKMQLGKNLTKPKDSNNAGTLIIRDLHYIHGSDSKVLKVFL